MLSSFDIDVCYQILTSIRILVIRILFDIVESASIVQVRRSLLPETYYRRGLNTMRSHNFLFRSVCRFIKYFFLFTFGLFAFCAIASLFEATSISLLILNFIKLWWLRVSLGSLLALSFAAAFESVQ